MSWFINEVPFENLDYYAFERNNLLGLSWFIGEVPFKNLDYFALQRNKFANHI